MIPAGFSEKLLSDRLIDRLAYAHDASMYRILPKAISRPENESDVISILKYANDSKTPVTFSCLLYTSPSPRDKRQSRMPSSA